MSGNGEIGSMFSGLHPLDEEANTAAYRQRGYSPGLARAQAKLVAVRFARRVEEEQAIQDERDTARAMAEARDRRELSAPYLAKVLAENAPDEEFVVPANRVITEEEVEALHQQWLNTPEAERSPVSPWRRYTLLAHGILQLGDTVYASVFHADSSKAGQVMAATLDSFEPSQPVRYEGDLGYLNKRADHWSPPAPEDPTEVRRLLAVADRMAGQDHMDWRNTHWSQQGYVWYRNMGSNPNPVTA